MPRHAPDPVRLPDKVWHNFAVLDQCRAQDGNALLRLARKYGNTNESIGYWTGLDPAEISKRTSASGSKADSPITSLDRWQRIADGLSMPDHARLMVGLAPSRSADDLTITDSSGDLAAEFQPGNGAAIERLRLDALNLLHGDGGVAPASVDEWEMLVLRHGRETRTTGSSLLLRNLLSDFAELQGLIRRRPPLSTLLTLSRASAQLAGLISLTLLKTGDMAASRRWSKAAWYTAVEVGDGAVSSWVKAQESYADFYSGDVAEAVRSAQHAQVVSGGATSVGFVLAAALEARAHAVMGNRELSLVSIGRAETALGELESELVIDSAFGYDEGQLRFHEGDALARLGESERASNAFDRALRHYAKDNYLDRSLVALGKAESFGLSGDDGLAVDQVIAVIAALGEPERDALIVQRAREVGDAVRDVREKNRLARGLAELAP